MTREIVVEVENLCTCFDGVWVHRDLDLSMYRGEVLGIIGGSGSGKTVLMNQVIGLLKPESGRVKVLGENVHELEGPQVRLLRRRWGVLFQRGALFSAFNVFDNIAFPLRELRKDGEKIEEKSIYELVQLNLNKWTNTILKQYGFQWH